MKKHIGFTLIELMVAVAVVGVVVAIGMPSFGELLKNNRMVTQANTIIASLHQARSETINRGISVRIEPLVAGTDWSAGWQLRIDGSNPSDNDFDDDVDIVIRSYEALKQSTLTSTVDNIIYLPDGSVSAAAVLTLIANECTREHKRIISIKLSGFIWLDPNDKTCP
ncbi:MAG: GspH/FimT family pseudopilin [Proteobacteria bacterium]|nr:GspH/FimT family pseudopilin [Pseudomonadota bacterium]